MNGLRAIKRGYQWGLFASGLFVPITAILHFYMNYTSEIFIFTALAVVLSLLPIYLPGNLVWSTGVICYIFVLFYYGLYNSFIPLLFGTLTVYLKHSQWNFRRVNWFRFFVTMGMYLYALSGSCLWEDSVKGIPTFFSIFGAVAIFEIINLSLFLGIQLSVGQAKTASRSFKTFHLIPLFATTTILSLLISSAHLVPAVFYAGILLFCFILLSRQYFRAVETSKEAQDKYRLIAHHTSDLIVVIDQDAMITYASPSHEQVFQCVPEELCGTSLYDYVKEKETAQSLLAKIKQEPIAQRLQMTLQIQQHAVVVETELSPVLDERGRIHDFIVVSRDITERLQQQEYLIQAEKLAITGQLAAGIAHEIRNPLTSIKGFMQLLKEHFNELSNQTFDVIWSEINRIDEITSELLVLAKPQRTQLKKNDLSAIIRHVITLLDGQAHQNNIYFNFDSDRLILVECNANQMRQVFLNIFKNSIESMAGGGTIDVRLRETVSDVTITVTDEGTGIPDELISTLGEPFYTTKEKGTGLGLMVVYNVIQEHGGTISIDSQKDKGTKVCISLPSVQLSRTEDLC